MIKKRYLGDSVYASYNGISIRLTTENGDGPPSNEIYIESFVFEALLDFVEELKKSDQHAED